MGAQLQEEDTHVDERQEGVDMVTQTIEGASFITGASTREMGRPQPGSGGMQDGLCGVSMNFLQGNVDAEFHAFCGGHTKRKSYDQDSTAAQELRPGFYSESGVHARGSRDSSASTRRASSCERSSYSTFQQHECGCSQCALEIQFNGVLMMVDEKNGGSDCACPTACPSGEISAEADENGWAVALLNELKTDMGLGLGCDESERCPSSIVRFKLGNMKWRMNIYKRGLPCIRVTLVLDGVWHDQPYVLDILKDLRAVADKGKAGYWSYGTDAYIESHVLES